jgi:hypothetical protein
MIVRRRVRAELHPRDSAHIAVRGAVVRDPYNARAALAV